ncbi:hypothetical protein HUN01_26875 [Nostoc edaphicum CCNP1411]|uniref:Glycosyltransferase RgtA/B/C/D-like domain-containing protein n=1 Tax=Nostoc edaphicum CCNP1411 TaxID=1472755 RepID=A0A7D7LHR1_9NOSO|nr:hypothetical protein [Nostoc edaphicum]QMS91031.1 hypothetical protein HUN01_26875 [Nostoc edaphicum CCNP1411]
MQITSLHKFLTATDANTSKFQMRFWFGLNLIFAIFYSLLELQQAFSNKYAVQDDARVYVFWMQRFLEPDILPNDLIADYFESVTPVGFSHLYKIVAMLGIEPLLFSKLLPVLLKILTICYWFPLCMQIFPVPTAAFISTLLLAQNLSMRDDLVSASPRSFIFVFFIAFLYYLLRQSLLPCLGAIALVGLFYPPFLLIIAGILILRLWHWKEKLPQLSNNRRDYLFSVTGLVTCLIFMLPYALSYSKFGPSIAGVAARELPGLAETGRISFFSDDLIWFWLLNQHSGLIPNVLEHPLNIIGLFLPIILHYPQHFPLTKQVTDKVKVLPHIALASVVMFGLAHLLLYKLYSPARYTRYTLKFIVIIATGIVIVAILDAVFQWAKQHREYSSGRQILVLGFTSLLGILLFFYPCLLKNFPTSLYRVEKNPLIYEFFQKQPKDILIASLSENIDNVPTFSKRSILIGWEYSAPYHVGYDNQITERATDLIRAQYSDNLAEVQNFIQKYGVDFFVLDESAFTPEYITINPWFIQWQSIAKDISLKLQQGTNPALLGILQRCSVLETKGLIVIQAKCVAKTPQK